MFQLNETSCDSFAEMAAMATEVINKFVNKPCSNDSNRVTVFRPAAISNLKITDALC